MADTLEEALKNFQRGKRRRDSQAVAGVLGATGDAIRGQGPSRDWFPGAKKAERTDPLDKARQQERFIAQMEDARMSRAAPAKTMAELAKRETDFVKTVVDAVAGLRGREAAASATVQAARNAALASGGKALIDAIGEVAEDSLYRGGRDASIARATDSFVNIRGLVSSATASGGEAGKALQEQMRVIANEIKGAAPGEKAATLAVLQATWEDVVGEGGQTLGDHVLAMAEANDPDAVSLVTMMSDSKEAVDSVLAQAGLRMAEVDQRVRREISRGVKTTTGEELGEDAVQLMAKLAGGDEGGFRATLADTLKDLADEDAPAPTLEAIDRALTELDESPEDELTVREARNQLFSDPKFKAYMEETGITDPRVALRQLKREVRAKTQKQRVASREAAKKRQVDLAAGVVEKPEQVETVEAPMAEKPSEVKDKLDERMQARMLGRQTPSTPR